MKSIFQARFTKIFVLAIALASVSVQSALFAAGGKGDQSNGKHLIVAVNPDYVSFDPGVAYEPYGNLVLHPCYDTLVEFRGSMDNLVPAAAESWTVSADGLTYTFKLKPGVKFSSGNPVRAADVVWSVERAINLKGNGAFLTDGIASVKASDAGVVFVLKETDPAFLTKLSFVTFSIIDSETAKQHGATNAANAASADTARSWFDTASAGSGPYVLTSYTPNVEVVLSRNDNYRGPAPYYGTITLKTVTESNTQAMMLQKGDIDIAYNLGPEHIKQLQGKTGVSILTAQSFTASFLLMNRDAGIGGPVANPKVQKAIRYAIDYKGIQTIAGTNMATPQTPFPLGLAGSLPAMNVQGYPDIAKAKALLAEAGFAQGFSTKLYVPTNNVVGVELLDLAQKVQNDLAQVGIKAELVPEDIMISFDTYRDGRQPLGLWYWSPDYPDNSSQFAFLPGESVGGVRARWAAKDNPALAALGKQAATEVNDQKRLDLFKQIQNSLIDDSPFAMLLQHSSQYAVRTGVKGAEYIELYQIDLNQVRE